MDNLTIYDVAKAAQVSVSTVSRVLNGKDNIKLETRKRVQEVLDKYQYTPNEIARGLANKTTKSIGVMVVDIRNVHHAAIAYTIEQELSGLGYTCIFCNTGNEDEKKEEYLRVITNRKADGIIFIGSVFATEKMKRIIKQNLIHLPIVMANGYLDLPNVHSVLADEQKGVTDCIDLLCKKGRKNIAYVQDSQTFSALSKRSGYETGMANHGLTRNVKVIESKECTIEAGYASAEALMQGDTTIDGIIFGEDTTAVGGMRALMDMGYVVPKDVAVVGIDNSVYAKISYPTLTSLDNKLGETGIAAARIITDLLAGKPKSSKILFSTDIVEREST